MKNLSLTILCLLLLLSPDTLFAQGQSEESPSLKDVLEKSSDKENKVTKDELIIDEEAPEDEFNRGQPRGAFQGFVQAAKSNDFTRAVNYIDFRNIDEKILSVGKEELARQLYVVLNRTLWIDIEEISANQLGDLDEKGVPSYRELIGKIDTVQGEVSVFLQHVPRANDRVKIWKISNATLSKVPRLTKEYSYTPLGEWLSKNLPAVSFLSVMLWQWVYFFYMFFVFFLFAKLLTWVATKALLIFYPKLSIETQGFIRKPIALLLSVVFLRVLLPQENTTLASKAVSEGATLLTIAWLWVLFRLVDLMKVQMAKRFIKQNKPLAVFLLRPAGTVVKSFIALITVLIWFENLGFSATTLLAGLGIGGLAIALAAQKTVENLIGAITLYTSAPVKIGDFCRFGQYLGVVEEIGLRATRIRTIERTVIHIANAKFIDMEIENFSEREKIAFRTKVLLTPSCQMKNVEALLLSLREYFSSLDSLYADLQRVHVKACTSIGIELNILLYVETTDFDEYLDEINQLNLTILSLLEQHHCSLQVVSDRVGA